MKDLNSKLNSKFSIDVLWNLLSYGGIIGIGILINILIVKFYDEAALGVFNQTYAVYIFLSQLAVGGVHLSVQYFVPKYSYSKKNSLDFLITALISSLFTSVIIVFVGQFFSPFISNLLKSPDTEKSLKLTLWGLLFFSLNKVILSYFNGLRKMKTFAFFQFMRFFLMLLVLLFFIFNSYPAFYLASILSVSEFILFLSMIVTLLPECRYFQLRKRLKNIFLIQFIHGNHALIGNFLLDLNTKVDVFMLGIFLDDTLVGIYSFAATMFEGFSQISVLLRNNFNPILTRAFSNKKLIEKLLARNLHLFYKVIFITGILSILVFPIVPIIFNINNILSVSLVYSILCIGFIISGGYQVILMIFNQAGYPKLQTSLIFFVFISNVFFNLIFIPFLGIYGAAIGTSFSFIIQIILIKYLLKKKLNIII